MSAHASRYNRRYVPASGVVRITASDASWVLRIINSDLAFHDEVDLTSTHVNSIS